MTLNNYQWKVKIAKSTKSTSVCDDAITILASQVEDLGKKIDSLSLGKQVTLMMQCDVTEAGMISQECLPLKSNMQHEQVEFMDK